MDPEEISPVDVIKEAISGIDEPQPEENDELAGGADPALAEEPKREGDKATEETPEQKAAKEAEAAKAKPTDDEETAKLRKEAQELGLKTTAQDRFIKLNSKVKELDTEKQALTAEIAPLRQRAEAADQLQATIRDTGITPENFGMLMQVTRGMNSGDPAQMAQSLDFIEAQAAFLRKALGRDETSIDPDIAQELAAGQITKARALEIQQHRAAQHLQGQRQQVNNSQQQEQQAKQQGAQAVAQFEQSIASDPAIAAKMPHLTAYLQSIVADGVHPSRWVASLQRYYASPAIAAIKAAPVAPPRTQTRVGTPPLRPTGSGNNMAKNLTDPFEAMKAGIASVS